MPGESMLLSNAESYAKRINHRIFREAWLGGGTDGGVWRSTRPSAIKALWAEKTYRDELESYRRLRNAGIYNLCGFDIPRLFGWDDSLQVIEMSIVQPPYLLDFGKVYFDGPPTDVYDRRQMRESEAMARAAFGLNWPEVARVLYALQQRVNIWYVDPKPANIDFGRDDPDWDKEPKLDYSVYEDDLGAE